MVNIGSLMSEVARPTVTPYTATKGGDQIADAGMAAKWADAASRRTRSDLAICSPTWIRCWSRTRPSSVGPNLEPPPAAGPARRACRRGHFLLGGSRYVNGQIVYVDHGILAFL